MLRQVIYSFTIIPFVITMHSAVGSEPDPTGPGGQLSGTMGACFPCTISHQLCWKVPSCF